MFSFLIQLSRRWTPRRPGVSASSACHDRRLSVARWVTPYGREAHWFSANTAALPLLSSAEAVAGALVGDGHIFGEKLRECSLLKKIKQCLVGECWVWGLIILFIILLYSSFFIGDYHIPIGKSYEKRWIQGGKLWTVGASRWLKQSFVSQLGVKRFDGTSFVTYSYFELRYILFGWIHQASWCLYAMFDCHRVFTFAFTFTEPWSWWTWWMIKVGRGRAEKGFNTYWLVVSNMTFIFHDIWDVIFPID